MLLANASIPMTRYTILMFSPACLSLKRRICSPEQNGTKDPLREGEPVCALPFRGVRFNLRDSCNRFHGCLVQSDASIRLDTPTTAPSVRLRGDFDISERAACSTSEGQMVVFGLG